MKQVRNTHSGVISWFPDNQADWLVRIGRCEYYQERTEQDEPEKEAKHVAVIKPAKKQPAKVATGD